MSRLLQLAVLISGRGSNMLAIARACAAGAIPARVALVAADGADAGGLALAAGLGLPTAVADARAFRRDALRGGGFDAAGFEARLAELIDDSGAGLVALAGFMRILSPDFVAPRAGTMLNIHPSLLPDYKGLHTHRRILADGGRMHGASVHYVTPELDGGPVVLQARVPVLPGDDEHSLSARIQQREHIIYPRVIDWIARGRLAWREGAPWLDGRPLTGPLQEDA